MLRFLFGLKDRHCNNFSEKIRHSERQLGNFLGARKHSHNTCIGRYIPEADGEIFWVLVDTRTTLALDSKYRKKSVQPHSITRHFYTRRSTLIRVILAAKIAILHPFNPCVCISVLRTWVICKPFLRRLELYFAESCGVRILWLKI